MGVSCCLPRRFAIAISRLLSSLLRPQFVSVAAWLALVILVLTPNISHADEDGISFWIPGTFGSLAAVPQQPGWSLTSIYYHDNVSASGNAAVAREITIGQFNPKVNVNVNANVHALVDVGIVTPSYVLATPVLGGQVALTLSTIYGNNNTTLNATTANTLGPIPFTKSIALQQDTMGFGDLYLRPMFTERWNAGVHNYMAYLAGDIPVGRYSFWRTSASVMVRWMAALATPISTRRLAMSFQLWPD
jgi:hypothetical protein